MHKTYYWPDNPFLVFFLTILLYVSFFKLGFFWGLLFSAVFGGLAFFFRVTVDKGFVTAHDNPGTNRAVIIPRKQIRVVQSGRLLGSAHILNDRTSTQEIVLYDWMFSRGTLRRLSEALMGTP